MSMSRKSGPRVEGVTQHILQIFPTLSPRSSEEFSLPKWAELVASVPIDYDSNAEIFGEQEPVQYLYKIVEGAVRTYRVLKDGRRQIAGFYLPGEFFGIEIGNEHALSAEAITKSKVLIIKRNVLAVMAEQDVAITQQLWNLTERELERAQTHAALLIMSASERVAEFLLEMASRRPESLEIDLPMPQRDIADYVGLTIETVSRILGSFESANAIERPTTRRLVLRNRAALNRPNGGGARTSQLATKSPL